MKYLLNRVFHTGVKKSLQLFFQKVDSTRLKREVDVDSEAQLIDYKSFNCFWAKRPWTSFLGGKKVLVVHPFVNEISCQYRNRRTKLFNNTSIITHLSTWFMHIHLFPVKVCFHIDQRF